ncbi:Aste57867_24882 [Aphanomyces stellatus]|uniref:Aste57867_24882 protein n=1 Tax=Aphanomyces stellatus TaxID=120398 RepID=A0A485LSJ9_9STRA|nr:hypothetical protein As57867_024804 [Aphanomyces stellatus]VFU01516.1 Aste57867_24882 [Aphanomyces stellatus]
MKTAMFALVLAAAAAAQSTFPTYDVPAFDLSDATQAPALVAALKETGIVALKNLPNFESTRAAYLKAADACVSAQHGLVSHKRLVDGTRRRTLSTYADVDLVPETLTAACPDYVATLTAFDAVVDRASLAFAKALDGASGAENQPVEDVIKHGEHLDHLHAYSNPTVSRAAPADLSLEWHTDAGLVIFTAAPTFFDGANNEVTNPDENAGLVVQFNGTGYKPTQKADELLVMVGQGFNDWGHFGLDLPPVLHAMIMPRAAPSDLKRIFYGRMALLKPSMTMTNTKMTYDEFTQSNKRFLLGQETDEFATIACPIGRQLQTTDPSCTVGIWVPSDPSIAGATNASCMRACNVDFSTHAAEAAKCKALQCVKTSEVADGGTTCWMVCIQKFTAAQCPSQKATCDSDQLVCSGGASTSTVSNSSTTTTSNVTASPSTAPTTTPKSSAGTYGVGAAVAAVAAMAWM